MYESCIPSLSKITSCKCKKGRCDNRRCKCVNVGFLCSDVYNCIDCENHNRQSDDEDTSDSEIEFSDSDVTEMNLIIQVLSQTSLRNCVTWFKLTYCTLLL